MQGGARTYLIETSQDTSNSSQWYHKIKVWDNAGMTLHDSGLVAHNSWTAVINSLIAAYARWSPFLTSAEMTEVGTVIAVCPFGNYLQIKVAEYQDGSVYLEHAFALPGQTLGPHTVKRLSPVATPNGSTAYPIRLDGVQAPVSDILDLVPF